MKCYAVLDKNRCKILKIKNCKGCAFFRTPTQNVQSLDAVFIRLASLEALQQIDLADRYYGGKMPWQGAESLTTRGYFDGR